MFTVLRQRNFALLWFGQLISVIGDLVLFIALPFYIFQLTGSALATGGMFIAQTLPGLFLGPLAGVFVDRWDRRWTMIISDLSRACVLLLLLFVHSRDLVWVVYVAAFVEQTVSQFFFPAKSAIIPNIVSEKDLVAANSLNAFSDAVTRFIGPPLGGALLGLAGLASVVFIDTGSYLVSAAMILLILLPRTKAKELVVAEVKTAQPGDGSVCRSGTQWSRHSERSGGAALANVWRDLLDGLRLVVKDRVVGALFIVVGLVMLSQGIINVLIVVFVKTLLHGGASIFGLLVTIQGVGTLLGSFLIAPVSRRVRPAYLIMLGTTPAGLALLLLVSFPLLPLVLGLVALIGLLVVGAFVTQETLLQNSVADEYRGRVFGSFGTIQSLLMLVGIGLGSVLGDRFGVAVGLDVAGVFFGVAGVVALVMLRGVETVAGGKVEEKAEVSTS